MLTRSGVAKRLGKSLATVRRMEGVELHPTRDERGVHRFDPDEVEAVARGETSYRGHRADESRGFDEDDAADSLSELLARREAQQRAEEDDLRRLREREEQERRQAIQREVERQVSTRIEQFEKERLLGELLATIEEDDDVLDDDELDELWDIVNELVE